MHFHAHRSPGGPWSEPQLVPGTDVFADSNFAPVINHDGSLVALAREKVYAASDWRNVSTYKVVGTWADEGEDPFVWVRGNRTQHLLYSSTRRAHSSSFSANELTWM